MRFSIVQLIAIVTITACSQDQSAAVNAPAATPSPPTVLASTRQLMLGLTIPASDVVFQASSHPPTDDAEWDKIEANALTLAESGNLLKAAGRAVDAQDWSKYCDALIATSQTAARAAHEKDIDRVFDAGNQVYEVCDGCHKKYMAARGGV